MDICFYNMNHIGDIYLASLFINIICKLNANITFYYYFINADVFFEKIHNIKRLGNLDTTYRQELVNGEPPENLLDNEILNILLKHQMQSIGSNILEINGRNILFINTWSSSDYLKFLDFDLVSGISSYEKLIYHINKIHNLNLHFKIENTRQLIEHLNYNDDIIDTYQFKDTIFIFNYKPRSLVFDMNNYYNNIFELSKNTKIILSIYESRFDNHPNIKFIDKHYNIHPDPRCENLLKIWNIAINCNKVIILPTGSSWIFLHKLDKIREDLIFMFNSENYRDLLNKNINYILGENKNLIKPY